MLPAGPAIRSFFLLHFLLAFLAPFASAQRDAHDIPIVTRVFAIENARIVQAPGRVIERGTVIIRDGLIESVGNDLAIPYDAERIAGDSLTVYAAFIDGLSHTGVPEPKEDTNTSRPDDPGNPSNERAGIQPDRDVRSMLSSSDKSVASLRKQGFGASHVVPYGRMLPGTGAIVLLSGDSPNDMVLRGNTGLFAQFQGGRGVYPGTPMAMTARMRQLYRESEQLKRRVLLYDSNPTGLERPKYSAVDYAFFPIIDKKKPVFFEVDDALSIHRALDLQKTLGFRLVLTGLQEAFDATDVLASAGIPLFLTLTLPDKPKWMAKLERDSIDAVIRAFEPERRTATFRDLEAERRNLEARQLITRDRYEATAALLAESKLAFGFSTLGVKPDDIRPNIRTMIERGLSEDAALAALTTSAAELLGLSSSLGSVDAGKIANLIVADGPVFDEKTYFPYVFVDGRKFTYEKKKPKEKSDGVVTAAGTWTMVASTPDGDQSGSVVLKRDGGTYSGTISYEDGSDPKTLYSIELDGDELSFSWDDPENGTMSVEGTISDDSFSGIALLGGEEMTVTGTRESTPEVTK